MLRVEDLSLVGLLFFGFFDEPDLSGVAVEADCQVSDFLDNFSIRDSKVLIKIVSTQRFKLNLVENFVRKHPL